MMNARLVQILLVVPALAAVAAGVGGAPMLPEHDPLAPFRAPASAREAIVRYFEASKSNDAATASSFIDYSEWAKSRGLEGDDATAWAKKHRADLAAGYAKDKAEGVEKEFRVVKETHEGKRAVFEVAQKRAEVTNLWQVTLVHKGGRWAIAGFRLLRVSR